MATSKANTKWLETEFSLEKKTKSMVRFTEEREPRTIGTLYMSQTEFYKMGSPGRISVVVKPA